MTKKIIAIELTSALNTIAPNSISHRIAVDNQAICNGIASPTKASLYYQLTQLDFNMASATFQAMNSLDYFERKK